MISTAVYVTSDEARIFKFTAKGIETHKLHAHGPKHQNESLGKNHPKEGGDADRFYREVAEYLIKDNSARWLLVGPGLAKTHLKAHIERHHAKFAGHIFGVETMDKATDGEITNFAHDYFKKKGLFDSI